MTTVGLTSHGVLWVRERRRVFTHVRGCERDIDTTRHHSKNIRAGDRAENVFCPSDRHAFNTPNIAHRTAAATAAAAAAAAAYASAAAAAVAALFPCMLNDESSRTSHHRLKAATSYRTSGSPVSAIRVTFYKYRALATTSIKNYS